MKHSIITLNWNTTKLLIGLYESLLKNTKEKFEFIIVDNGSKKDELKLLLSYFNQELNTNAQTVAFFDEKENRIIIHRERENRGFAAGNNEAISYAEGSVISFINSDIVVDEKDWDQKVFDILGEDVGCVGCAYHPLKWDKNANFHIQPVPSESVDSETVQGAFFSVTERALDDIKIMPKKMSMYFQKWFDDDNFPMAHYEETDLQLRMMQKGYKIKWIPIKHQHLHNRSATKSNGYHLNDDIKDMNDFKRNSNNNKMNLLKKHQWFFGGK